MSSNIIRFVFENKIHEIKNLDPNETILNFIRLRLKKTGTKEGCAEGGCGACTVVIGELKKNNIVYKAINSCIAFTTSLEGKQLLVVEDLIQKDNNVIHSTLKLEVSKGFVEQNEKYYFKVIGKFNSDEKGQSVNIRWLDCQHNINNACKDINSELLN